jgi:hypothetical protein
LESSNINEFNDDVDNEAVNRVRLGDDGGDMNVSDDDRLVDTDGADMQALGIPASSTGDLGVLALPIVLLLLLLLLFIDEVVELCNVRAAIE